MYSWLYIKTSSVNVGSLYAIKRNNVYLPNGRLVIGSGKATVLELAMQVRTSIYHHPAGPN